MYFHISAPRVNSGRSKFKGEYFYYSAINVHFGTCVELKIPIFSCLKLQPIKIIKGKFNSVSLISRILMSYFCLLVFKLNRFVLFQHLWHCTYSCFCCLFFLSGKSLFFFTNQTWVTVFGANICCVSYCLLCPYMYTVKM